MHGAQRLKGMVIAHKVGMKIRRRGSKNRDRAGQAIVEFALAVPIVLFIVFSAFEMGFYFFSKVTVRHSVLEATRFAVTGNKLIVQGDTLSRADAIVYIIQSKAQDIQVDLDGIQVDPPDGGGPEDLVRISVTYRYVFWLPFMDAFFPEGSTDFTVSTVMKNEPFFGNQVVQGSQP